MSDRIPGFRGKSIAQVQADCFGRDLPKADGVFSYRSAGLNAPAGTVVLFQFQARIIASAVLLRDEKFKSPRGGRRGRLHLDASSIRTFEPMDFAAMRRIWPGIRPFGHVKQMLNPTLYAKFRRRLKGMRERCWGSNSTEESVRECGNYVKTSTAALPLPSHAPQISASSRPADSRAAGFPTC